MLGTSRSLESVKGVRDGPRQVVPAGQRIPERISGENPLGPSGVDRTGA